MTLPTISTLRRAALRLYHCERGAEGLEKLLIVGAIVIPLLGVLIFFRNDISQWVEGLFSNVKSDAEADPLSGN